MKVLIIFDDMNDINDFQAGNNGHEFYFITNDDIPIMDYIIADMNIDQVVDLRGL